MGLDRDTADRTGHVILCGLDRLGFRTLEELGRLGEEVVVIAGASDDAQIAGGLPIGVTVIEGSYRNEAVLRRAGVVGARSLIIAEDDDVGNLHAALTAQELNPDLRLVVGMFDLEFGRRVQILFHDCAILSSSAIAAPAFVSAALHQQWQQHLHVAERLLVVRKGSATDSAVVLPLAPANGDEDAQLFPTAGDDLLCLAAGEYPPVQGSQDVPNRSRIPRQPFPFLGTWATLAAQTDPRNRNLGIVLAVMVLVSSLVFYFSYGLNPIDALYFTVTIITTTGFGDINLHNAPMALKLYGVVLMLFGATTLAVFYALITDALVGARLPLALGGVPPTTRDHVVVCGLGNVGYRVVAEIAGLGLPVVAVELHETARFLRAARQLGVPVVAGDAGLIETLESVQVARARCLIAVTNDDITNLKTALNARVLNPHIQIVLRLFDPDLAARVERAFDISMSQSVPTLAAPAFAAAALGRRVIASIPVGMRILLIADVQIATGAWAVGKSVGELEEMGGGRILLLSARGDKTWRPARQTILAAGHELVVVATRPGLAQTVAYAEATDANAHVVG